MNNLPLIITIDGPAGVGKTTVARQAAAALKIAYLDTGAMFRAVAWMLGPGENRDDQNRMSGLLAGTCFDLEGSGWDSSLILNGNMLGPEIRTEEVGMRASNVGRLEIVRNFLKKEQRKIGASTSLVAEGRDMGSVVFPDAPCKFFLDASAEVRAGRRHSQLERMGVQADYNTILDQIKKRDDQDRNRAIAPLKPAPDALIIDTGALSPDEVLKNILDNLKTTKD
ncbi:MAG: (d)CMP kinase [Desulfonatronovibrio sp.]